MLEITMTVMCKNKGQKLCGWIERTVEHLTMYLVILDREDSRTLEYVSSNIGQAILGTHREQRNIDTEKKKIGLTRRHTNVKKVHL